MLNTIKDGNVVKIEGILSEIDIDHKEFVKNGNTVKAIGGVIKIRVDLATNGDTTTLEIPVHMFASALTNAGQPNPAYESICRIKDEYVSIAASDIDHADRVRITKGSINMNEYYGQDGRLISFPRITASFVSKIKREECKPKAEFNVTFMVGQAGYELDKDGVETDKYKVLGMIPQFGGNVDVVPFYAHNPGVIDALSQYWQQGDTVRAIGRLNFTSETREVEVKVDFGEPSVETRTYSISELVITGGSSTPLEGEFAINEDDMTEALEKRKARLAESKARSAEKGQAGKAPAPTAGNKFKDLGF
jgi:hypothetical protein